MVWLATSCLQGSSQLACFIELIRLHPEGIQWCPGLVPSAGMEAFVQRVDLPMRFHHGFSFDAYRAPVYDAAGDLEVDSDRRSVHPPSGEGRALGPWLERRAELGEVIELMPPGRWLGCEAELEMAMALGVRLAVDVSHLHIQRHERVLGSRTLARLFDYAHVAEIHVSDNDGTGDHHAPITSDTFGLAWAKERAAAGVPLVLECYMHRMSLDARRAQLEVLR